MSARRPGAAVQRKDTPPVWRAPGTVACRGEDTSLFYPGEGESPVARERRVEKARSICASCLHVAECLDRAMAEEKDGGGRYGIKGGLTEHERKLLQRYGTQQARRRGRPRKVLP